MQSVRDCSNSGLAVKELCSTVAFAELEHAIKTKMLWFKIDRTSIRHRSHHHICLLMYIEQKECQIIPMFVFFSIQICKKIKRNVRWFKCFFSSKQICKKMDGNKYRKNAKELHRFWDHDKNCFKVSVPMSFWSCSNMIITAASICSGHFGRVAPQLHVLPPSHWGILANCDNQELKSQKRKKKHFDTN